MTEWKWAASLLRFHFSVRAVSFLAHVVKLAEALASAIWPSACVMLVSVRHVTDAVVVGSSDQVITMRSGIFLGARSTAAR